MLLCVGVEGKNKCTWPQLISLLKLVGGCNSSCGEKFWLHLRYSLEKCMSVVVVAWRISTYVAKLMFTSFAYQKNRVILRDMMLWWGNGWETTIIGFLFQEWNRIGYPITTIDTYINTVYVALLKKI